MKHDTVPSMSGRKIFSWVSVCFKLLGSNVSIPDISVCWVFSAATSARRKPRFKIRNTWRENYEVLSPWKWNRTQLHIWWSHRNNYTVTNYFKNSAVAKFYSNYKFVVENYIINVVEYTVFKQFSLARKMKSLVTAMFQKCLPPNKRNVVLWTTDNLIPDMQNNSFQDWKRKVNKLGFVAYVWTTLKRTKSKGTPLSPLVPKSP